jgi:threonine aldolase
MLQYMFKAEVGDDVYKQDPTVIELEAKWPLCSVWKQDCFVGERWQTKHDKFIHNQENN